MTLRRPRGRSGARPAAEVSPFFRASKMARAAYDARLHRVVDALERRDVHEPRGVADHQQRRPRAPLGQRVVAALRDGLGAPLHHLAALEVAGGRAGGASGAAAARARRASPRGSRARPPGRSPPGSAPADTEAAAEGVASAAASPWCGSPRRAGASSPTAPSRPGRRSAGCRSRPPASAARPAPAGRGVPSDSTVTRAREVGGRRVAAARRAVALEAAWASVRTPRTRSPSHQQRRRPGSR